MLWRTARRRPIFFCSLGVVTALLLLPISYLAVHYGINAPNAAELPFHDSFAVGDLHAWSGIGMRQLCCGYSARVGDAPDRPGQHAVKFVLNRGDPDVKGNQRAELRLRAAEWGHEYDYSMEIFVPAEWTTDSTPVTVVQWHNVPDLWRGEWGLPGSLGIDIRGDEWVIGMNWGTGPTWLDRNRHIHSATLWRGPLDRGQWTEWAFHIKWSFDSDGVIDIRRNGELVAHYKGPNAYADMLAPYLKIGLYVWSWHDFPNSPTTANRREIWFSNVQVAQSR